MKSKILKFKKTCEQLNYFSALLNIYALILYIIIIVLLPINKITLLILPIIIINTFISYFYLSYKIKYIKKDFYYYFKYLKVYNSPFIKPKIKLYFGKVQYGTPYFMPRRFVKMNKQELLEYAYKQQNNVKSIYFQKPIEELLEKFKNYTKSVPKKIGFDFVPLGYKTKWTDTDYRIEYLPLISFVFFKWQFCIKFKVPHSLEYWECWLFYENNSKHIKNIKERIEYCKIKYPCTYIEHKINIDTGEKNKIDYWKLIIKNKYK